MTIYIVLLALILRMPLLNSSLWLDESIQALALMGRMGPLMKYALADFQPPLYHLIGYVWTQIAGYGEVALRMPSLVAGILTVYFVIKIGELIGNKKIGIIAGLLAATNPLLIYYSGEGRTYAMTAFFATASLYYFIQLIQDKKIVSTTAIKYSLFTLGVLWTSYLGWLAILVQGIYILYKRRYNLLPWIILPTLTLLFWLPSLLSSLSIGVSTVAASPVWGKVVGGLSLKSLPLTWVKFAIGRISFENKMLYGAIIIVIAGIHAYALRRIKNIHLPVLLLWIIGPLTLGILVASVIPVYQYFRVLFVLPAYLLLLAIGLEKRRIATYLIIGIQMIALAYYWLTPIFHHEDWRALVRDLPTDAQVAMPSLNQNAPLLYYGVDQTRMFEPKLSIPAGKKPIYYIRYVEDIFDTSGIGPANLAASGYTITSQKVYTGIQLDIYENSN